MGFIEATIGGAVLGLGKKLFGGGDDHDYSGISAQQMMAEKKKRAIREATKKIADLKRKQGFSSTLFAGSYKPPKELKTLFADDASKTKTILGG